MNEIKSVIQRYCPSADRNVAVEVSIGDDGLRSERCLDRTECRDDAVCVMQNSAQ